MTSIEGNNRELLAILRSLERQGLIVSSLGPDGQIRWRCTEKGRREDWSETEVRLDLDS
jgi:hypothetical protein